MHTHPRTRPAARPTGGFSLIELVIVVVVIGLLAAVAIPRLSKGADDADAFAGDLAVLRNALELYALEHGGSYPSGDGFEAQLTGYTNAAGDAATNPSEDHRFGPYLIAVPPVKVGPEKGSNAVAGVASPPTAEVEGPGWLYEPRSGRIWANDADRFD